MEKLDFTCLALGKRACGNGKAGYHMPGLEKRACENGKDTNLHANKGNKHAKQKESKSTCQRKKEWTRKKRKTRNCVSRKRRADTQKREDEKLRVVEKRSIHVKQEKRIFACRGMRETGYG
jgi:hypothetical protein